MLTIVDREIQSPGAGVAVTSAITLQIPDGEWCRILDVRGSVQADATVTNRNAVLEVYPEDNFTVICPSMPYIPASTQPNTLFDKGGFSTVSTPPGHAHGKTPDGVFKGVVRVLIRLTNGQPGDTIGVHRVRFVTGKLEEFQL